MKDKISKEIVKYDGRWWWLESISETGMATIWRDGQPTLIPEKLIEYIEFKPK